MNVLVVGGAGYIGGAVTDLLLQYPRTLFTVFDNLLYEPHFLKDVPFIRGDVRDRELLAKVLPDFSCVVWLAAIVGDAACASVPELTRAINEESVKWLAENFDKRIIFTSTCSVYGERDGVLDEESPTNPLSLYAQTKLSAEGYLLDKNALILRLGTVFGISDTYSRPRMDLVGNQMPVAAATKGIITVNGGDQWRPMIHVRDVARTIVNNLGRPVRGIYNLATGNVQIRELAKIAASLTNCQIETKPARSDARNYRVTTKRALDDAVLSSNSSKSLEKGMREFVELIESERIKDPESNTYFNVRHLAGKI